MKKSVIILIKPVAVIVIQAISAYNGLVSMDENVSSQWANVDTVSTSCRSDSPLTRQYRHDGASWKGNTWRRAWKPAAKRLKSKVDATTTQKVSRVSEGRSSHFCIEGKLLAITENYPDLKANQNFLELQGNKFGQPETVSTLPAKFKWCCAGIEANTLSVGSEKNFASIFGFENVLISKSQLHGKGNGSKIDKSRKSFSPVIADSY